MTDAVFDLQIKVPDFASKIFVKASKVANGYFAAILGGYHTMELSENDEKAFLDRAQALADLKFTYVVSCQMYGAQKNSPDPRDKSSYTNILKLMLT